MNHHAYPLWTILTYHHSSPIMSPYLKLKNHIKTMACVRHHVPGIDDAVMKVLEKRGDGHGLHLGLMRVKLPGQCPGCFFGLGKMGDFRISHGVIIMKTICWFLDGLMRLVGLNMGNLPLNGEHDDEVVDFRAYPIIRQADMTGFFLQSAVFWHIWLSGPRAHEAFAVPQAQGFFIINYDLPCSFLNYY